MEPMTKVRTSVPVLDLSTARSSDGSFSPEFIDALRDATHNVGFFQVVGYGGSDNQAGELLDTLREFFARPVGERLLLDNRNSPQFRGYTRLGKEVTQGRADAREQIDYGPARPALENVPEDQPHLKLQGPNQWPSAFPQLEEKAMDWAALMSSIGDELLSAIAVSLELPADYFAEPFSGTPAWMGKLVHYVGTGAVPEAGSQGVGAHADYGFVNAVQKRRTNQRK